MSPSSRLIKVFVFVTTIIDPLIPFGIISINSTNSINSIKVLKDHCEY